MQTPIPNPPLRLFTLVNELRRSLEGCRTVLEVGCGVDSPMQFLRSELHLEGLDIHQPALDACLTKGFVKKGHLGSALDLADRFSPNSFDAVVALDLIEHVAKEDGHKVLTMAEQVARRRVVVFTPNGFVPQSGDENPWMEHKCGWEASEFEDLNYAVRGINGWKNWRGEYARLKYKPRFLWALLSEASHYGWTASRPEKAYSLLATKAMEQLAHD